MNLILLSIFVAVAIAQKNEEQQLDNLFKDGNDQFTAKMFSEVVRNNPDKSVVLSAFSVLTPLAQLSLASTGASHDELLKAIGLPNDNATKDVFSHLNRKLQSVKGIELKTASKIYVAKNYELNPVFSSVTKQVFNSEVKNIDFTQSTDAANEINRWVEEQTNNRIKDLVSADILNDMTRSVLVNAVYLKGSWSSTFDKERTKEEDFQVSKEKTVKVSMMHQRNAFGYADSTELNAQVLELQFLGRRASFVVILPKEIDGIAALVEKLNQPSVLNSATSAISEYYVDVSLPKFRIETVTNLKEVLQKIDVKRIFDHQQAQLTHLLKSHETLYVSQAVQKAFIDVNEEGVEAGAATEFDIQTESLPPPSKFTADHPFVFVLKEGHNILFSGVFHP